MSSHAPFFLLLLITYNTPEKKKKFFTSLLDLVLFLLVVVVQSMKYRTPLNCRNRTETAKNCHLKKGTKKIAKCVLFYTTIVFLFPLLFFLYFSMLLSGCDLFFLFLSVCVSYTPIKTTTFFLLRAKCPICVAQKKQSKMER